MESFAKPFSFLLLLLLLLGAKQKALFFLYKNWFIKIGSVETTNSRCIYLDVENKCAMTINFILKLAQRAQHPKNLLHTVTSHT